MVKKTEKYKNEIIIQEKVVEKAVGVLSNQQKELEKIKEELNLAQKGYGQKRRIWKKP